MADTFEVPPDPNNPYAASSNPDAAALNGPIELETNNDARMWGMLCHISSLAFLIVPYLGNVIGPLIVWQVKKSEYPFVDVNGKESLNFQISMTIYTLVSSLVLAITCIGAFLLIVTLPALAIASVVFAIIAGVKANNGETYRYPLTIRLIK